MSIRLLEALYPVFSTDVGVQWLETTGEAIGRKPTGKTAKETIALRSSYYASITISTTRLSSVEFVWIQLGPIRRFVDWLRFLGATFEPFEALTWNFDSNVSNAVGQSSSCQVIGGIANQCGVYMKFGNMNFTWWQPSYWLASQWHL